jgi:hypothetical protein
LTVGETEKIISEMPSAVSDSVFSFSTDVPVNPDSAKGAMLLPQFLQKRAFSGT